MHKFSRKVIFAISGNERLPKKIIDSFDPLSSLELVEIDSENEHLWDNFIIKSGLPSLNYSASRLNILRNHFNYSIIRLICISQCKPVAAIAIAHKHKFGLIYSATSLPHSSFGGILCDDTIFEICLQKLIQYMKVKQIRKMKLRQIGLGKVNAGDVVRIIHTSGNFQKYWTDLGSKTRSQIHKVEKLPIKKSLDSNHLEIFYENYCTHLKEKGTPPHSIYYWDSVLTSSGSKLVTYWLNNKFLGGGIVVSNNGYTELEAAVFTKEGKGYQIGMLMYKNLIESCFSDNTSILSLGRSEFGSSVDRFKEQWKSQVMKIDYFKLTSSGYISIDSKGAFRKTPFKILSKIFAITPMPVFFLKKISPKLRIFLG